MSGGEDRFTSALQDDLAKRGVYPPYDGLVRSWMRRAPLVSRIKSCEVPNALLEAIVCLFGEHESSRPTIERIGSLRNIPNVNTIKYVNAHGPDTPINIDRDDPTPLARGIVSQDLQQILLPGGQGVVVTLRSRHSTRWNHVETFVLGIDEYLLVVSVLSAILQGHASRSFDTQPISADDFVAGFELLQHFIAVVRIDRPYYRNLASLVCKLPASKIFGPPRQRTVLCAIITFSPPTRSGPFSPTETDKILLEAMQNVAWRCLVREETFANAANPPFLPNGISPKFHFEACWDNNPCTLILTAKHRTYINSPVLLNQDCLSEEQRSHVASPALYPTTRIVSDAIALLARYKRLPAELKSRCIELDISSCLHPGYKFGEAERCTTWFIHSPDSITGAQILPSAATQPTIHTSIHEKSQTSQQEEDVLEVTTALQADVSWAPLPPSPGHPSHTFYYRRGWLPRSSEGHPSSVWNPCVSRTDFQCTHEPTHSRFGTVIAHMIYAEMDSIQTSQAQNTTPGTSNSARVDLSRGQKRW